jgi:hypothetical protein
MPLEPLWGDKTQTHTGETTWTNRTSCMAFSCTSCTRKLPSHSWTESTTVSFIAVSMATQLRYSELSSSVFNNFCRTATSDRTNPYDAKDGTDNRFIWSWESKRRLPPSDHYYLSLIWMYMNIFYCINTSILAISNSGQRDYHFVIFILFYVLKFHL